MRSPLKLLLFLLFASVSVSGQTAGGLTQRPYKAAVLTGQQLPLYLGQTVSSLRLMRFDMAINSWTPIPFQVDEKDGSWSYFRPTNGLLDSDDEIVFMAADGGDRAEVTQWPDNEAARNGLRTEIAFVDDLTGETAWIYCYHEATLPLSPDVYIVYDEAMDQVDTDFYEAIHLESGFQESMRLKYADESMSEDFLDRQKLRLKMKIDMGPLGSKTLTLREQMDEDVEILIGFSVRVTVKKVNVVTAPSKTVRLNRSIWLDVSAKGSFAGYKLSFRDTLEFLTAYYPAFTEWRATDMELPELDEGDITELRLTADLNQNSVGMIFHNDYNEAWRIDASPDDEFDHSLTWPGSNWYMITANAEDEYAVLDSASIIGILNLDGDQLGSERNLFYQDLLINTHDDGDATSFGETGLQIKGRDITGIFTFYGGTYYLPWNVDAEEAAALVQQHNEDLLWTMTPQEYTVYRQVTVDSHPSGRPVKIDGVEQTTPAVMTWPEASQHSIQVDSLQLDSAGHRYRLVSWSHGLPSGHQFTVGNTDTTLVAEMIEEYWLATAVQPPDAGLVTPAAPGLWTCAGDTVECHVEASGFNLFKQWQGSVSHSINPFIVVVDSAMSITAVFANDTPVLALSDTSFAEDDTLFLAQSWLADQCTDDHADSLLTFMLTPGDSLTAVWQPERNQWAVVNRYANWFGSDTLRIAVTDPLNATDSGTIVLNVIPQDDAPLPFALSEPVNNFEVLSWPETITFTWEEAVDPDPADSILYVFQLDTLPEISEFPLIQIARLHQPFYKLSWPLSYGDGAYYWRVLARDRAGNIGESLQVHSLLLVTPVTIETGVPTDLSLAPNYPNPFNGETVLTYSVPRHADVSLTVYNSRGQAVAHLLSSAVSPGVYQQSWSGLDDSGAAVASGVYIVELKMDGKRKLQRILLLR